MARLLVEHGAEVIARDNEGLTPRDVASRKGYVEVARFLEGHGAHTVSGADDGRTSLPATTEEGEGRRASATAGINNGWTPLYVAAVQRNVEVVRILVERGADTMALMDDGRTPLHVAAEAGNEEIVRIFVEHGTNRTTAHPTSAQGSRLVYYFVALCFFVEIWVYFVELAHVWILVSLEPNCIVNCHMLGGAKSCIGKTHGATARDQAKARHRGEILDHRLR